MVGPKGGARLWVEIKKGGRYAKTLGGDGKMRGYGGFPGPAFPADDRDGFHGAAILLPRYLANSRLNHSVIKIVEYFVTKGTTERQPCPAYVQIPAPALSGGYGGAERVKSAARAHSTPGIHFFVQPNTATLELSG